MSDRLDRVLANVQATYALDLRWMDEVRTAITAAEDELIAREVISRLPTRLVHEVRNEWAYREAEVTAPLGTRQESNPETNRHWKARADESHVSVEKLGNPAEYVGFDPIDDVALEPQLAWTDADKKAAMERVIRFYGLEPGQWIDLEWPPTGRLWDPGHVYSTEFEPCDEHDSQYYEDPDFDESMCDKCQAPRNIVESPAKWIWTTTLTINEIVFDLDGNEDNRGVYTDNAFEVATTEQDPREILIGPPGEGRRW